MQAIGEWGVTWSFTDPRPEELDPDLLIVWMARHVDREQLPPNRTVVQFDFRDPAKRYWMVLERSEVSVCLQHPGFDVDLEVTVDTATLYRVYLGRAELGGAMRGTQADAERPEGAPARVRTLVRLAARSHPASRRADERRRAASRLAGPERVRVEQPPERASRPSAVTELRAPRAGSGYPSKAA